MFPEIDGHFVKSVRQRARHHSRSIHRKTEKLFHFWKIWWQTILS